MRPPKFSSWMNQFDNNQISTIRTISLIRNINEMQYCQVIGKYRSVKFFTNFDWFYDFCMCYIVVRKIYTGKKSSLFINWSGTVRLVCLVLLMLLPKLVLLQTDVLSELSLCFSFCLCYSFCFSFCFWYTASLYFRGIGSHVVRATIQ